MPRVQKGRAAGASLGEKRGEKAEQRYEAHLRPDEAEACPNRGGARGREEKTRVAVRSEAGVLTAAAPPSA